MSLTVYVCESCGGATFPRRLLCPRCGGRAFRDEPVERGTLEGVGDRGAVRVGAVRTAAGPLAIVRIEGDAQTGAEVALDADGEVPVARAEQA